MVILAVPCRFIFCSKITISQNGACALLPGFVGLRSTMVAVCSSCSMCLDTIFSRRLMAGMALERGIFGRFCGRGGCFFFEGLDCGAAQSFTVVFHVVVVPVGIGLLHKHGVWFWGSACG